MENNVIETVVFKYVIIIICDQIMAWKVLFANVSFILGEPMSVFRGAYVSFFGSSCGCY